MGACPGNSRIESTPEEVCAQHPELLSEVREQLKRTRTVEAHLEELFPSSSDDATNCNSSMALGDEVPKIPGYELEEAIGEGGMGIVLRARHLGLNRLVAIKMLLSGAFAGRSERARFIREAEAVAALSHAHIVQVYDVANWNGGPTSRWSFWKEGSLAQRLGGVPQLAQKSAQLVTTLATAVWRTLTSMELYIATSSPVIFCSPETIRRKLPTSVWRSVSTRSKI